MIKVTTKFVDLLKHIFFEVDYEEYIDNGESNLWIRLCGEDSEEKYFTLDIDIFKEQVHFKKTGDFGTHSHRMENIFNSNEQLLFFLMKEKFIPNTCELLPNIHITPDSKICKRIGKTNDDQYYIYEYLTGVNGYVNYDTRFEVRHFLDTSFKPLTEFLGLI